MTCQLYRHFGSSGDLLYVGISLSAVVRLCQHRSSPWFKEISRIEIERCQTREYAQFSESVAIKNERPRYNKVIPSYDPESPSLMLIVVQEARNEIWLESWNQTLDHSRHQQTLEFCNEMEADALQIIEADRRTNPFEDAARGRDPVPKSSRGAAGSLVAPQTTAVGHSVPVPREANPVAKATKGKTAKSDDVPKSDRVVSRLGAGRTAQDSPQSETAGAVAIRKPGRPKIEGPRPWQVKGISKSTYYRSLKEQKAK